jgi:hypothetical protein
MELLDIRLKLDTPPLETIRLPDKSSLYTRKKFTVCLMDSHLSTKNLAAFPLEVVHFIS